MDIISPYDGGRFKVTSSIGNRIDPINGKPMTPHYGLDLVGLNGKTILAVAPGVVGFSGIVPQSAGGLTWQWGNYIRIDGDDGRSIYYCHLSQRLVKAGDRVQRGDAIGIEGSTGYSTGSHLHIEMRVRGKQCAIPVRDNDPANIAAYIGIPNAVGVYTAEPGNLPDMEYIKRIVQKVGYDRPEEAIAALNLVQHKYRNAFLRKLWEALR